MKGCLRCNSETEEYAGLGHWCRRCGLKFFYEYNESDEYFPWTGKSNPASYSTKIGEKAKQVPEGCLAVFSWIEL